jgi:tartrate-resistant acid phosphatase type 5
VLRTSLALLLCLAGCTHGAFVDRDILDSGYADHSDAEELSFLVFGDQGTGALDQYRVGAAMHEVCGRLGCDFALVLGDNIYDAGIESVYDTSLDARFELPYEDFGRFDFWLVPGNHDHEGSVPAEVEYTRYSDRWRMPAASYAVPGLPDWLAIWGFDTDSLDPEQLAGAREVLCNGEAAQRLAFGHHPIWSNGEHGGEAALEQVFLPLFEECGVGVYFAGHDHHQEHVSGRGLEQVVQGAAAKLRTVGADGDPTDGVEQRFAAARLGFAHVEATRERMRVRYFDEAGLELYAFER